MSTCEAHQVNYRLLELEELIRTTPEDEPDNPSSDRFNSQVLSVR